MAQLFSVKENTITYHIKEIYKTEELEKEGTARKIRVVRKEGNRNVSRNIDYFNLDMIISVGYKVNSKRGIKFRQWASMVLKEYLLKGYAINNNFQNVHEQINAHDKRICAYFEFNPYAIEVMIFKGHRQIVVKRQYAMSTDFVKVFMMRYNNRKAAKKRLS